MRASDAGLRGREGAAGTLAGVTDSSTGAGLSVSIAEALVSFSSSVNSNSSSASSTARFASTSRSESSVLSKSPKRSCWAPNFEFSEGCSTEGSVSASVLGFSGSPFASSGRSISPIPIINHSVEISGYLARILRATSRLGWLRPVNRWVSPERLIPIVSANADADNCEYSIVCLIRSIILFVNLYYTIITHIQHPKPTIIVQT